MPFDNVLVIGAGGTGSYLFGPLVKFLCTKGFKGKIVIADGDEYEVKNADRQNFLIENSGTNKAEYQVSFAASSVPQLENQLEALPKYLGEDDLKELITDKSLIISCVDSISTRRHIDNVFLKVKNGVHLCCGNDLFTGQVHAHIRIGGKNITPGVVEKFPLWGAEVKDDKSKLSCQEISKLPSGGQTIMANIMSSAIALNFVSQLFNPVFERKYISCGTLWFNNNTNDFTKDLPSPSFGV